MCIFEKRSEKDSQTPKRIPKPNARIKKKNSKYKLMLAQPTSKQKSIKHQEQKWDYVKRLHVFDSYFVVVVFFCFVIR